MKKKNVIIIVVWAVLMVAVLVAFFLWGGPYFFNISLPTPTNAGFGAETVKAQVVSIENQGTITLGTTTQFYQVLNAEIIEGQYTGTFVTVNFGKDTIQPAGIKFTPGDQILVTVGAGPDGSLAANYSDAVRTRPILILTAVFVLAFLLVARWKGVRSLLALIFSFGVIALYVIPHIIHGEDPVRVSIIGSMLLLVVTLYLTYGWNLKTHAAVISILAALLITGLLAWGFVQIAMLTGNGNEDALYLMQVPGITIDLRGLLLGGMIIGALGVLDDLVITQASAVFELHEANPELNAVQLFSRGFRIGQDHVASTVNTLVMAYTGVALPTLILFTLTRGNYADLLNVASVAEEIVRTLVGSLGLVAAVPISTLCAALLVRFDRAKAEEQT